MTAGRILLAVTADVSLGFVAPTARHLAARGWEVHVAATPGPRLAALGEEGVVRVHPVPMVRDPSPLADLRSAVGVARVVRRVRPEVLSAATPKAGLLFTLVGALLRVPVRVHQLWGLRYETATGPLRRVLVLMERLSAAAATDVVAVSESLRATAVADGVVRAAKVRVLGPGSSHGVDLERYRVTDDERLARRRARWDDADTVPTVGFIGRLNPDKGIDTLVGAVRLLAGRGVRARLVLVGGLDGVAPEVLADVEACGWPTESWGETDDVTGALAHLDLLCLPTRREGFPNVVLEAAVAGLPTVATPATGAVDAVRDQVTGLLARSHDPADLADALERLLRDPALRRRLGEAAREVARDEFDQELVWRRYEEYYADRLAAAR